MIRQIARPIQNERGVLTLDFIFALMLGMGFTMVFFALTLTLSLVEVTQYISFSVARTSWAAHETRSLQMQLGNQKYAELLAIPVFRSLFGQGWFRLPTQPNYGGADGFNTEYQVNANNDSATFYGVRLQIEARILDISIPMLGTSKSQSSTGVANVQTFLGREVTTTECRENFNRARWTNIQGLDPAYATAASFGAAPGAVALITDNGC